MLSEAKNTKTFEHHLKLTQKTQDGVEAGAYLEAVQH